MINGERQESLRTTLSGIGRLPAHTNATSLDQFISDFLLHTSIPQDHYFYRIAQECLLPSVFYLEQSEDRGFDRYTNASKAWVHFAIGSLLLYVPDKAFDPALKPFIQRQRHENRRTELEMKLQALRQAEELFTGQTTNSRIGLIEQELQKLGEAPSVPAIARPLVSELTRLQGEFSNLRESVILRRPEAEMLPAFIDGDVFAAQEVSLLRRNIAQIVDRLLNRFREYDDVTAPVVGLLHSLNIGFELSSMASSLALTSSTVSHMLMERTPFLGGSLQTLLTEHSSWPPFDSKNLFPFRVHYLKAVAISAKIQALSQMHQSQHRQLFEVFHGFYLDWKEQLEREQKKATASSGLYRYRGGENDDDDANEEAFRDIFPDYDAEQSKSPTALPLNDPKKLAADLANLHSNIFASQLTPSAELLALLEDSATQLGTLSTPKGTIYDYECVDKQISGVIISLYDSVRNLEMTDVIGKNYSFYSDANLGEAKKLISLVYNIQLRFRQLREAWPEHATLQDVLTTCDELLAFGHAEPVAKFLTKAEKLHGYIHEWQIVASREYSAVSLYDELTTLLVSWRRVELATWARLFDIETSKCEEDAKAWWFIAYEVVVAVPLSLIVAQEEMDRYARELLQTLETFFSTTSMGQFSQRLKLLRHFEKHVALLALENMPIKDILQALQNFIRYYSRFEHSITEALAKGKASLEKDMREVVLLASWKDVNINALRESARRSHHKLFKLVRKYRALLAQPVDLPKQGLPEHNQNTSLTASSNHGAERLDFDQKAMELCQASVPGWSTKSARFTNIGATTATMRKMSELDPSAVDGAAYCDAIISNIVTSTEDLRKQTPSVLNKENKDMLGHLKSRKRKLLADTMKELRHMGVKSNLSSDAWAKQESLTVILAETPSFEGKKSTQELADAEFFFHKSLELMPSVRNSVREHSDDLTSGEVVRCVGYAGGLVSLMLEQRKGVSTSSADLASLEAVIEKMQNLWAPEKYRIRQKDDSLPSSEEELKNVILWLPHILQAGIAIIEMHAKLSQTDSSQVLDALLLWKDRSASLVLRWNQLPNTPQGLSTTMHTEWCREARESLENLRTEICQLKEKLPLVAFALNQILLWTHIAKGSINGESAVNGYHPVRIPDLEGLVTEACDSVLVGMQQVKQASLALPSTTEDAGWLVRQDRSLAATIKAFHVPSIVGMLEGSMSQIAHLQSLENDELLVGTALFAVILPIVRQYASCYNEAVDRYCKLHRSTCKMTYTLMKSFSQVVVQGFCSPSEKSSSGESQSEKLESGTGLGEGEGAEDISKDVQEDEDLSELAQQPDTKGDREEVEDEKDAVDMEQNEMEGEMGSSSDKGEDDDVGSDREEEDGEIDEEAGNVDDLDPAAVDEKLWDGDDEEAEKDQQGDQSTGKKQKDEQAAAKENGQVDEREGGNENDEVEEEGAQENENIGREEPEKTDPHLKEGEKLDLPDEMDIDGDKRSEGELSLDDSEMDELSDVEQGDMAEEQADTGELKSEEGESTEEGPHDTMDTDMDNPDLDAENEEEQGSKTEDVDPEAEEGEESIAEDNQEGLLHDHEDDATVDTDAAAHSDVQGLGDMQDQEHGNEQEHSSDAQRNEGAKGDSSNPDQEPAAAQEGRPGQVGQRPQPGQSQDDRSQESPESQAFKKLGDVLKAWHRQQREIRNASEGDEQTPTQQDNADFRDVDFEHLPDGEAQADTQALGAATEDQAHALDESKALESGGGLPEDFGPDEKERSQEDKHDPSPGAPETRIGQEAESSEQTRPGAFIGKEDTQNTRANNSDLQTAEDEEDVEEVDTHLSTMQLDPSDTALGRSQDEARQLWTHFENATRSLSLSLTEQLRLILAPTVATKMRGDFRTGKRLNIKRIIPYIASQYKRDKIWMRRSVPSKRNYQIMIAVDDSKSMNESGSADLAFETLALISKSLSMLEVGEICIVGFGEEVKVAHAFDTPFTNEAGAHIFQQFTFNQSSTDVRKLVSESISLFRSARNSSLSTSNTDLWQLELIISDGVCQDHSLIQRLVRQAQEEQIMIVFVIIDNALRQGESIMEMKEARFETDENGDTKLRMKRYLDDFPFAYYLVVKDVRELPNVLAGALRQWFAEVVDSGT